MAGHRDLELFQHERRLFNVLELVEQHAVEVDLKQLQLAKERHRERLTQLQILDGLLDQRITLAVGRTHLVIGVSDLVGGVVFFLDRVDHLGDGCGQVDAEFLHLVDALDELDSLVLEVQDKVPGHLRSRIAVHTTLCFGKVFRHVIVSFFEG
jgi:hypothetical protein